MVGKIRNNRNRELMEKHPEYQRGDKGGVVNQLGISGELIAQCFLSLNGINYDGAPLLSDKPESEPDIITKTGCRIDVKAVSEGGWDFLVNKDAHLKKEKNITHYLFVKQVGTTAKYRIFTYEEVSGWKIKNVKYSDAYYLEIDEKLW